MHELSPAVSGAAVQVGTIEIDVRGRKAKAKAVEVNGQTIAVAGRGIKMAVLHEEEWLESEVIDPQACVRELKASASGARADIFCFTQKVPATVPRYNYPMEMSSVAVARVASYKKWWDNLPRETRRNIKRSQRRGVVIQVRSLDADVIQGICDVQNETPVRQGRLFPHYGKPFEQVKRDHSAFLDRSDYLCAYCGEEFIGFIKVVYRGDVASILNLSCKTAHYDNRTSNALLAKAAEICAAKGIGYLTYGKFNYGNKRHDTLREFKARNGFAEMMVPAYYVPLTRWGAICVRAKFYRGLIDILPQSVIEVALSLRTYWYKRFAASIGGA